MGTGKSWVGQSKTKRLGEGETKQIQKQYTQSIVCHMKDIKCVKGVKANTFSTSASCHFEYSINNHVSSIQSTYTVPYNKEKTLGSSFSTDYDLDE